MNLNQDKYVLEFELKNDKNITVENSKAVFHLILENDEEPEPKPGRKDSSNEEPINNDNNLLTEEEIIQMYDDLNEEMNIQNVINKDAFKIKLVDLLKKEKENYEGMSKDEIISDLKEKMTDLVL